MNTARRFICKMLIRVGNSLTVIGRVGFMLDLSGVMTCGVLRNRDFVGHARYRFGAE